MNPENKRIALIVVSIVILYTGIILSTWAAQRNEVFFVPAHGTITDTYQGTEDVPIVIGGLCFTAGLIGMFFGFLSWIWMCDKR